MAHVEAGLRSFDRSIPEEINRILTDSVADLLLTPSEDANENLRREGIAPQKIQVVGNIMIDSLVENLPAGASQRRSSDPRPGPGKIHLRHPPSPPKRRSPRVPVGHHGRAAPVIRGPPGGLSDASRTRKRLEEFGMPPGEKSNLHVVEPVGYHDSLCLTENARLVLTDSGGLQEESTYFRTPCLTLRPNTERPVTLTLGSNRLTAIERLQTDFQAALSGPSRAGAIPPLWDGRTASRIIEKLVAA